jgi:hypothetical protein
MHFFFQMVSTMHSEFASGGSSPDQHIRLHQVAILINFPPLRYSVR